MFKEQCFYVVTDVNTSHTIFFLGWLYQLGSYRTIQEAVASSLVLLLLCLGKSGTVYYVCGNYFFLYGEPFLPTAF